MNNKEICERLNQMLSTLTILEEKVLLDRKGKQFFIERYVELNGVRVKVNTKLEGKEWDREKDSIQFVAWRKEKREKLEKFIEEMV